LKRLPASKRVRTIDAAASLVLKLYGFEGADVTVTPTGDAVRAVVPAGGACTSTASTEGRIAAQIRRAVPIVQSVQITVGGTGASLSQYVHRSCQSGGLPLGSGPVVLTQQGSRFATTRSFTVHSRRWTIDYVNGGDFLQVLPMRGDLPTIGAFTVTKRTAGKRVLTGAGTFRLRVGGSGDWTIRVRDSA
jgi:hypothetical protein